MSTRSQVPLKGSARTVAEFFEYSVNSILYQRGIYPSEDFQTVRKYDLNMLVTTDSEVRAYIKKIMGQLHRWLVGGKISTLVVVIVDKDSSEVVERWQFNVRVLAQDGPDHGEKPAETVQREIQAIIRQITASVTFLPEISGKCTFNVLVYADSDADVPAEWTDSEPKLVDNGEEVQLRSFATGQHRVDTMVAYKLGE